MTVTTTALEPCVSLTTGVLSPDERVNYAYGMVLGLDEFLQEQLHNLSKDYLHERALHGYGTASGLHVAVAPVDGAADYQVSVTTGIAVDQWGREIVITCEQCARIGAWLAAQEQAGQAVPAENVDAAGVVTVYVTAAYAECLDDMVPLPGQPCSSSDQTMVASRIRDAWDVELSFSRPAMPRWDTDRRLARLLATVAVVPGLAESSSDEAKIADAVRALATVSPDGPDGAPGLDPAPGTAFQLPADTAAAALDRILTVWVTEVRPGLQASTDDGAGPAPDLVTATTDPRILLSTIRFTPATPFDPTAPAVTACDDPDDEGRPYLLHTELIQELRLLGGDGASIPPVKPAVELATMVGAVPAEGPTSLDVWFHLDDPVQLPATIGVTDEDGNNADFATQAVGADANGFSSVWQLVAPDVGMMNRDGLQVSALLPATTVLVRDPTTTLADVVPTLPPLVDTTGSGDVLVYAEVRVAERPAVDPPVQRPPSEFATISGMNQDGTEMWFEIWFHPEPYGETPDATVQKPVVKIFDDTTGDECEVTLTRHPASPNVWQARLFDKDWTQQRPLVWLRFYFPTDEFGVDGPDGSMSVTEWIDKRQIQYVGWDPDQAAVVMFARVTSIVAFWQGKEALDPAKDPAGGPPVVEPLLAAGKVAENVARAGRKATASTTAATKQAPAKKTAATKAPAKKTAARKAPAKKAAPTKAAVAKKAPARGTRRGRR